MELAGYVFVPRTPPFPGEECWALREGGNDGSPPPPHCFEHPTDAPR
ncbi:MAG TPA: hypothetical protein VNO26_10480 [Candidatus Limnocylindria bacterium]|nr:hypothetical protein [Candidatus Limnocylindria bacterium]